MTKQEALAKLREQGHEVTAEEAKALDALLSTGELDESALESVVGGISPRFKKALIGAGILVLATAGGVYALKKQFKVEYEDEVEEGTELPNLAEVTTGNILPPGQTRDIGGHALRIPKKEVEQPE